jgi:hypothetical protein
MTVSDLPWTARYELGGTEDIGGERLVSRLDADTLARPFIDFSQEVNAASRGAFRVVQDVLCTRYFDIENDFRAFPQIEEAERHGIACCDYEAVFAIFEVETESSHSLTESAAATFRNALDIIRWYGAEQAVAAYYACFESGLLENLPLVLSWEMGWRRDCIVTAAEIAFMPYSSTSVMGALASRRRFTVQQVQYAIAGGFALYPQSEWRDGEYSLRYSAFADKLDSEDPHFLSWLALSREVNPRVDIGRDLLTAPFEHLFGVVSPAAARPYIEAGVIETSQIPAYIEQGVSADSAVAIESGLT